MKKVTYLDHSGFAVSTPAAIMVFDYYKDPDKKLEKVLRENEEVPVLFFVTHHHADHFNTSIFELAQNRKRVYILSNDIFSKLVPKTGIEVAWMSAGDIIEQIPGVKRVEACGSTDAGVSYAITLPDDTLLFHAGDLNDWHWGDVSTPAESQAAQAHFEKIVNNIAQDYPNMHIVMFPVDARMGTDFARGANIFLSKIQVDYFFPMHFWDQPQKACDFAAYLPAGSPAKCLCLDRPGAEATLPC